MPDTDVMHHCLSRALFADSSQQAYLLLDPVRRERDELLPQDGIERRTVTVEVSRDKLSPAQCPMLVCLLPQDVDAVETSLELAIEEQKSPVTEQGRGFAIGGWLTTAAEPEKLARYLARRMRQAQPGHPGLKYIRWADRRVLEWMWPVLDDADRTRLLGPITAWWTLDRCQRLVKHAASGAPASKPHLLLSPTQWQHAEACGPAQGLLRGWRQISPLPEDYVERVTHAVREVRSLGLRSSPDIVLMGMYVLQVHPNLCRHPQLRERVRGAREQGRPLAHALASFADPDDWNQLRDELQQTHFSVSTHSTGNSHG